MLETLYHVFSFLHAVSLLIVFKSGVGVTVVIESDTKATVVSLGMKLNPICSELVGTCNGFEHTLYSSFKYHISTLHNPLYVIKNDKSLFAEITLNNNIQPPRYPSG